MLPLPNEYGPFLDIIDGLTVAEVRRRGGVCYLRCSCPAHDDKNPSMDAWVNETGWLTFKCFAGCSVASIHEALGIERKDCGPELMAHSKWIIASKHIYRDEDGTPLRRVTKKVHLETGKKQYPCEFYDENGDTHWGDNTSIKQTPYCLERFSSGGPVFVVEGEKDADNLNKYLKRGVATTNKGGATNWRACLNKFFKDRVVFILPDNDEPGEEHARVVLENLEPVAKECRIVRLPGLKEKGDVSDFLESYETPSLAMDKLRELIMPPDSGDQKPSLVDRAYEAAVEKLNRGEVFKLALKLLQFIDKSR